MNQNKPCWAAMIVAILYTILLSLALHTSAAVAFDISDEDKRGFGGLRAISLDVDGDGKVDTIQPRTYSTKRAERGTEHHREAREEHWIAFDLILATGRKQPTFFRYRYGDDRADYWAWALKSAGDMNGDGRVDLVFYAGDDTTDETVLLVQDGRQFKACSTGVILGDYQIDRDYTIKTWSSYDFEARRDIPAREIARWNPRALRFDGTGLFWVCVQQTTVRSEPQRSAGTIVTIYRHDALIAAFENDAMVIKGDWIKVNTSSGTGWVRCNELVPHSPTVRP